MRKSKFSEEQIIRALRNVEGGTPAAQVCRKLGISQATFGIFIFGFSLAVTHEIEAAVGLCVSHYVSLIFTVLPVQFG